MGGQKRPWDADDNSPSEESTTTHHRDHGGHGAPSPTLPPRVPVRPQPPPEPGVKADGYYRQLYASEPDFRQLAREDAQFKALLRGGNLDFNEPEAVMQLTKTLLNAHFGLKVELPKDRLCPPVPNRHNYILWLKDLLDSSSYDEPGRKLTGLDIGTGASCIYPLLSCTQRDWSFIATDIDDESLTYAKNNVARNNFQHRIQILPRLATDPLLPLDAVTTATTIDFVMTNPPFYESEADMVASAQNKSRPPFTACTGSPTEMVTPGGEVAFVRRILDESLAARDKVRWYSSMLGKQSSLETLVAALRDKGVGNYAVAEFVQGNRTRRWAIAWSFAPMRPSAGAARGLKGEKWKKILPPPLDAEVATVPLEQGVGKMGDRVDELMCSLELVSWAWDKQKLRGVGRAPENVWSRSWRRKKVALQRGGIFDGVVKAMIDGSGPCAFGFEIDLDIKRAGMTVRCCWREGHDASLFESFCGFLRTRLAAQHGS
ncbi:hypothetical protein SODALDRAFT_302930 [Sodiomyces alkalinus F11]|uniref:U6 small nuclear RNA (adenine-(43)-N(6))-methyltransferase n=1 Tax=Sodiomyces alkalinus (strain CBS 110278 / VKM F-3762 / F11) TaxID=1314773 RepID=A0A3N2Q596_SODAK|nr:hypothetical protein SODALDRAFT_302930 [Sodiomyces alkalinus F11]ROT41941.1 hypothetical protein SODALDRAFT_302930 [Sodiomyces alkalinus F11]